MIETRRMDMRSIVACLIVLSAAADEEDFSLAQRRAHQFNDKSCASDISGKEFFFVQMHAHRFKDRWKSRMISPKQTPKPKPNDVLKRECRYTIHWSAYDGGYNSSMNFSSGSGARWDDFSTCVRADEASNESMPAAAYSNLKYCQQKGYGVRVLKLTHPPMGNIIGAGSCCDTRSMVRAFEMDCDKGTSTPALTRQCTASSCTVWGDPHIITFDLHQKHLRQHPKQEAFFRTRHWKLDEVNVLDEGTFWLVNSSKVQIQGTYLKNETNPEISSLGALAISGPFIDSNVLVFRPLSGKVMWNNIEILPSLPSEFNNQFVSATYHGGVELVRGGLKKAPGIEVHLPEGVKLTINRWQHMLAAKIDMCKEDGQDGQCGNFNGNVQDDSQQEILLRMGKKKKLTKPDLLIDDIAEDRSHANILSVFKDEEDRRTKIPPKPKPEPKPPSSSDDIVFAEACHYVIVWSSDNGKTNHSFEIDAGSRMSFDDFETCVGVADANSHSIEKATECAKNGLQTRVLRSLAKGRILGAGSCCDESNTVVLMTEQCELEELFVTPAPTGKCVTGSCTIWGDSHIISFDLHQKHLRQHPKREAFFRTRDWELDEVSAHEAGTFWLVNSSNVQIQGTYLRNETNPELSSLGALAVSGPFIDNNVLVVRPLSDKIMWNSLEILPSMPSEFNNKYVSARYQKGLEMVKDGSIGPGMYVNLPRGVKLTINRWKHMLEAKIDMCREDGQDGQCGNFDGNPLDDDQEGVISRMGDELIPQEFLAAALQPF